MSGASYHGNGGSSGTTIAILPTQVTTVNYAVGDNIRDPNIGVIFTCISATTASTTPPSEDPTHWIGQDSSTIGIISPKGQITDHDGWLKVDGREIDRTKYIRLFNAITENVKASTTSGGNKLRVEPEDFNKIVLGQIVTGTGIPASTSITALGIAQSDIVGATTINVPRIHLPIGTVTTASIPIEIDNTNIPDNTTAITYNVPLTNTTNSISGSGFLAFTTGSTTLSTLAIGDYISCSKFTGNPRIAVIDCPMDMATSANAGKLTGTPTIFLDADVVTIANEPMMTIGQYISAAGTPAGTVISSIIARDNATSINVVTASPNIFLPFGEYNATKYPINRRVQHANIPAGSQITAAPTQVDTTKTGEFLTSGSIFYCNVGQLPQSHNANSVLTHPGLTNASISSTTAEGTYATGNRSISGAPYLHIAIGNALIQTAGFYISHAGFATNSRMTAFQAETTIIGGVISGSNIVKLAVGANPIIGQAMSFLVLGSNIIPANVSSITPEVVITGNTSTSINVTGMTNTTGLVVGQYVTGSGIPANCRIASIINATSITLTAATTTTVTGLSMSFGKLITASANAVGTGAQNAISFSGYATIDSNATSTVNGTCTWGGAITSNTACTGSLTSPLQIGSRLILGQNATASASNQPIKLGAIITASQNFTTSSNGVLTLGKWCTLNENATSSGSAATTFGASLVLDQNATASTNGETFTFGENFTMSANATSTVDSGSFNLFVYGQGNGTTTFNLPNDPAGRALGFAGSGSGLTARSINTQAGTETHTLTLHEIPAHSHTTPQTVSISQGLGSNTPATDTTGTTQSTGSAGGGGSHNNISPVAFLGYAYIYAGAQ